MSGRKFPYFTSPVARYAWAAFLVALGAVARIAIMPGLPMMRAPFTIFYPVLLVVTATAGRGPAIFALALSSVAGEILFVRMLGESEPAVIAAILHIALFWLAGGIIIFSTDALNRWRRRAERDLAQRQQAERDLIESEARYRQLVELAPDLIFTIGVGQTQPVFGDLNPAFEQVTGWSRTDWLGRPYAELVHPEDHPTALAACEQARRGQALPPYELRLRCRDGRGCVFEIHSAPIIRDGQIIGEIGIARDISQRKQVELELRRAKDAVEAASAAKDQFLAQLSHELRTPLTPVVAAVSLLESDPSVPDSLREPIALIHRNVELETRLIDDLLDLTRIVRGKIELDRRPVELCSILHRVTEVCAPAIRSRGVHFRTEMRDCPLVIDADSGRLQQVFWNLINNSLKFTPAGGCVGLRVHRNDGQAVAEVVDSGEGIAPDVLPRIFNAFEQGSTQTTRHFGGLGLGLTICKRLVELHGGVIRAHSEGKGKGAVFVVELPLVVRPAVPLVQPATPVTVHERPPNPVPVRILLVEDHPDTAKVLRLLLQLDGHTVRVAGNLASAEEAAGAEEFDLILCDLGLPDGSGLDLPARLHRGGKGMVALSGYGMETDINASRAAGFVDHVVKPVDLQRLRDAIARATSFG